MIRRLRLAPCTLICPLALCALLAACGGGGSGGTAGSSAPASSAAPASGASTTNTTKSTTTPSVPQSTTANIVPVNVSTSATSTRNMLMASVTVCVPGTNQCATVDNVQVDTGSQGLRLLASALPAGFALPGVPAGSGGPASAPAGECAVFGTGYTWGAVRFADVQLAGETAASLPVQVIADPSVPPAPSGCSGSGLAMDSATALRANGILGVGVFNADCGAGCTSNALSPWYYACASGNCTATAQPLAQQVSNPVAAFSGDHNGVVIDLPAVTADGAASVSGSLIFGIGTQADNGLGSASVLRANTASGFVTTTTPDGTVYSQSYLDSGSNAYLFSNSTLARCGAWFCPASPQNESATITGTDGTAVAASFSVTSEQTLVATGNWAFDDLAGYNGSVFGWGLPFFYGRRVYTAIEAQQTPAGVGPFFAF
ncbi:DUF3443 domain-containing protein [Paraburkholderia ferrariae]|uniref:DUF3443 domain-containing protein n=1 Tax=Paraburkholderia ferrariae TaxID=386056 RepID=UPI0005AA7C5D|nr:DUF3443 domain-containing protein [Paraburkholderia ferrariae]